MDHGISHRADRPLQEHPMREERGSTTLWVLGLSLLLLLFGGIALDFWRGLAVQRELAAVADSAALAAASGIDELRYRASGELILDPQRAEDLARRLIEFQDVGLTAVRVSVDDDGSAVQVTVEGSLRLGLLGVFVSDDAPLTVRATARAGPRLVP